MLPVLDHNQTDSTKPDWLFEQEGQLSVDVIETLREIIVRSAIAGVTADDLDITLHEDTLTIRGSRHHDTLLSKHHTVHAQECHWGTFSRSIILPSHVDPNLVEAVFKKGVLTIRLKKVEADAAVHVLNLDDF